MDHCITHFIYLETIRSYLEKGGRSRGSYIVPVKGKQLSADKDESDLKPDLCEYDRDVENKIMEVCFENGIVRINLEEVREIPEQNLWFERVWKDYKEDIYLDC
jgi:hypothetical protein